MYRPLFEALTSVIAEGDGEWDETVAGAFNQRIDRLIDMLEQAAA